MHAWNPQLRLQRNIVLANISVSKFGSKISTPTSSTRGSWKIFTCRAPPLTFYTDYFTRIIYIAFYFPLSRVLVFRRKDARSPQTCDSIDRSVISTLERLKRNFFFLSFFVLQKLHGYIHGWAWTFPDKECNLFSWPRLQARNLSCKWHNTKVKLLT